MSFLSGEYLLGGVYSGADCALYYLKLGAIAGGVMLAVIVGRAVWRRVREWGRRREIEREIAKLPQWKQRAARVKHNI